LTFGPDGNLYVVSFISVLRYDGTTGAFLGSFASPIIGGPFGVVFGPDGNLYVGTFASVQRFNGTTGAFIDVFASTGLAGSTGLAFGPDHNLYVGSALTTEVVRFDGTTGALLGVFGSGSGLSGPLGLAFGADSRLYVASRDTDSVLRFDPTTGAFVDTFIASGSGGLDLPVFLAFTPTLAALEVDVDIKPGSATNPIDLSGRGVIPVAILSSNTFDATTVDPSTVCFGDDDVPSQRDCTEAHGKGHIADVNGDGRPDLLLHYEVSQTGIDPGDTRACLTAKTFSGDSIEGCDSIRTR
jgi:DNA-binding beta-propeller fold protein YncE